VTDVEMPDTNQIVIADQIVAVLDEFAAAWSAHDADRVASLWEEDGAPTYLAEELGVVLVGRASIVEHLARTAHRLSDAEMSVRHVQVRELTDDLVLAIFHTRWQVEWVSYSRVSAIFRRQQGRWLFAHYMEAPFHTEDWDDADLR
jgi:uncharacterized protein (TIGR02246 family)